MTAVVLIFSKRGGPATWHAATCPVVAKCAASRAHAVIRDELPYHADDLTDRGYRLKRCPCCTAADVERARDRTDVQRLGGCACCRGGDRTGRRSIDFCAECRASGCDWRDSACIVPARAPLIEPSDLA